MSLLSSFPSKLTPRKIQEDILNEIEQKFNSGYKKVVISAPTGVGKSAIAISLARYFDKSFIITASKNLQDQYTKDYDMLYAVKGKQNFPCLKLMEKKNIDDPILAQRTLELTCEKGVCIENKHTSPVLYCKFKPLIEKIAAEGISENMCSYYNQKYLGLISKHSLWNYSSYFQLMINKEAFSKYIKKPVAIFDEVHKIEDQILNFIGIKITQNQLEECQIDITRYKLDDIEIILQLLDDMRREYARLYAELKQQNEDDKKLSRYDRRIEKCADTHKLISEDKENFVINDPKKDIDNKFKSILIQPLDISKHVGNFFQTEKQVFMSATIDKNSFCETMGYDLSDVAFVDTPKSPFPFEHRKVNFLDIKRMNNRSTEEDELLIVKKIDELLNTHSAQRGLILTSSIKKCNFIKKYLTDVNSKRVRICHAMNPNQKTQEEILKEHANSSNSVLLSSSLWEGVDLKDDLSRFQIIAKIPYSPLKEKRTILKNKKYPLWYNSQTLMRLLQGFGRSIRSENDYAKTYVLDSAHNYLLSKTKNILPKAYYDIFNL